MKRNYKRLLSMAVLTGLLLVGCSSNDDQEPVMDNELTTTQDSNQETETPFVFVPELNVSFGRDEEPFKMNLYDNDTARAIARYVGSSDWNLPIYHYDDYENYEVMQYYDIPDRYEIPSNPETITSEKAGEVYYSEPNRIILFYHDANVSGEYTRLGYFDASDAFISAVENNPVVEGWGNKIISIKPVE